MVMKSFPSEANWYYLHVQQAGARSSCPGDNLSSASPSPDPAALHISLISLAGGGGGGGRQVAQYKLSSSAIIRQLLTLLCLYLGYLSVLCQEQSFLEIKLAITYSQFYKIRFLQFIVCKTRQYFWKPYEWGDTRAGLHYPEVNAVQITNVRGHCQEFKL